MRRYSILTGAVFLCSLIGLPLTISSPGLAGGPVRSEKPAPSPAKSPIDRKIGAVRLGMALEEFLKSVKNTEQSGPNLGLIEDERSFEVARASLPEEVRSMGCRFLHGRLFRITVEYRDMVFDEVRWDGLLKKNMEQYGKVRIQSKTLGERLVEIIQWDDPQTRLILQRAHRMGFESKKFVKRYVVVMILLDQALWKERQESEGSLF